MAGAQSPQGRSGLAAKAGRKAATTSASQTISTAAATNGATVGNTDPTKAIAETAKTDWASQIPLGRIGTPQDIAAAVSFLASDEASYITGQVLAVNGGMYM